MNKQSERGEVLKNGLIGTYAGTRISGKSYDPDGKEIEEVHEADCYCCRKDLFNPQPETQSVSVEETPFIDLTEYGQYQVRINVVSKERGQDLINSLTHSLATEEVKVDENTSDGYHTFKELYEYRLLYNAALFNEWSKNHLYEVHKSERHNDGEFCFGGGWFIVMATLPTGQISNHYEMKDWDLFKCRVAERADEWDGHTPQDVAERLRGITLSDSN